MGLGRILYVVTDLGLGGVPLHLLRLAEGVRRRGWTVRVFSLAGPGPVGGMMTTAGIEVIHGYARGLRGFSALGRLRKTIRTYQPEVVHSFLFHANMACRLMCLAGVLDSERLICEIQTVEISRRWHLLLDRWTIRFCRVEIGNSDSVAGHLARSGIPAEKLHVVRGSVEAERFAHVQAVSRSELGIEAGCSVLLWTGRLDPVKGLNDLLEAAALLRRSRRIHLLLAGEGSEKSRLQQKASQLGISGDVTFLGASDDVPGLLKMCDVFVFPSYAEGLPNSLLEAMAAGCVVVCTAVPGNIDLVADGVHGLCVSPGQPSQLAEAIERLLCDSTLRTQLGQTARLRAVTEFEPERMLNDYLNLYEWAE